MFEFIKKKWLEWLMSIVIVVISAILMNNFMLKRDANKTIEEDKIKIQEQLKTKANLDYVNQQDKAMKDYIDKADENVLNTIKQHSEETRETERMQTELIKSINDNVRILLERKQ